MGAVGPTPSTSIRCHVSHKWCFFALFHVLGVINAPVVAGVWMLLCARSNIISTTVLEGKDT